MDSRKQFWLLESRSRNSYASVTSANKPSEFLEDPSQSREAHRVRTRKPTLHLVSISLDQSNNYTFYGIQEGRQDTDSL